VIMEGSLLFYGWTSTTKFDQVIVSLLIYIFSAIHLFSIWDAFE